MIFIVLSGLILTIEDILYQKISLVFLLIFCFSLCFCYSKIEFLNVYIVISILSLCFFSVIGKADLFILSIISTIFPVEDFFVFLTLSGFFGIFTFILTKKSPFPFFPAIMLALIISNCSATSFPHAHVFCFFDRVKRCFE